MNVLACIKRVPDTGATIVLTEDQQEIDTANLGFTMSPHEECAIEEAVQIVEDHGGTATVLTLGPDPATEQLQTGLAMQADEAILLETDGSEWGPIPTARAIASAVRVNAGGTDDTGGRDGAGGTDDTGTAENTAFDLLLFGTESADAENYQVPVRVAHQLDLPCVTGIKSLDVADGLATATREVPAGSEIYELDLPAVVAVKEGLNEPRYPSMRSKMQARRQEVERISPERSGGGRFETVRLEAPERDDSPAEILGEAPAAADDVVSVLADDLEVL